MKAVPQATLHEPLRPDRGDDREQLLHDARDPGRARRIRSRSASPCAGEELLVLDEKLRARARPARSATSSSAGVGLSPGYWRDEEKTAAAFVPDPRATGFRASGSTGRATWPRCGDDGLVYFLGRADSQIKHRGYRIELGEIETALGALDELAEVAVVGVDTSGFEGTAICCAYAPADGQSVEPLQLRREAAASACRRTWFPGAGSRSTCLPKNVNGKIDRRSIREHFEREEAADATRSCSRRRRLASQQADGHQPDQASASSVCSSRR